nr:cytochrome P450 [Lacinutrix neustonica]
MPYSAQYFPFGAGPRKCIGNNFAMFEMIIAVTTLLKTYKIHPGVRGHSDYTFNYIKA